MPTSIPAALQARFRIGSELWSGSAGTLFEATEVSSNRTGVLKVVSSATSWTPAERGRLARELEKQATLNHPYLASPFSTGIAEDVPWIFRAGVDGESLADRLAQGPMSLAEAVTIAAQLASALDELHRAGLLQRDMSPGHVIVSVGPTGLPHVSLIDSGVATRIPGTSIFEVTGKPAYVSPEHAAGKLVSFRSDLYSLGSILYEMLVGAPLFAGATEQVLEAQRSMPAPTLAVSAPSLSAPAAIATLLGQLLAKDPRDRPFSAQQVRRALEPLVPEGALVQQAAAPGGGAKKTLLGIPSPVKRPDATEELSALDLHQAAAALRPSPPGQRRDETMPLSPGDLMPPTRGSRGSLPPPVPGQVRASTPPPPPAAEKRQSLPPPVPGQARPSSSPLTMLGPASPSSAGLAVPPAPVAVPPAPAGDLDYDDLAETNALSREEFEAKHARAAAGTAATAFMPAATVPAQTIAQPQQGFGPQTMAQAQQGFAPQTIAQPQQGFAPQQPQQGFAPQQPQQGFAPQQPQQGFAPQQPQQGFAPQQPQQGFAPQQPQQGFAPQQPQQGFAPQQPQQGFAPQQPASGFGAPVQQGFGPQGQSGFGAGTGGAPSPFPATQSVPQMPGTQMMPMGGPAGTQMMPMGQMPMQQMPMGQMPMQQMGMQQMARPALVEEAPRVPQRSGFVVVAALLGACLVFSLAGGGAYVFFGGTEAPTLAAAPPPVVPAVAPMQPMMQPVAPPAPVVVPAPVAPVEPVAPAVAVVAPVPEAPPPTPLVPVAPAPVTPAPAPEPETHAAAPTTPRTSSSTTSTPPTSSTSSSPRLATHTSPTTSGSVLAPRIASSTAPSTTAPSTTSPTTSSPPRLATRIGSGATAPTSSTTSSAPTSSGGSFDDLRARARAAFSAHHYDEAAQAYEQAARLQPTNASVYAGLGAARLAGGNGAAAVTAYERAVQLSPSTPGYHAALGRAYATTGDRTRARQQYDEALRLDPDNRDARIGLERL